jgi:hypothetical protein
MFIYNDKGMKVPGMRSGGSLTKAKGGGWLRKLLSRGKNKKVNLNQETINKSVENINKYHSNPAKFFEQATKKDNKWATTEMIKMSKPSALRSLLLKVKNKLGLNPAANKVYKTGTLYGPSKKRPK